MERQPWVCRVFGAAFAGCCAGLILLSLVRHDNPFLQLGRAQLIVCWAGMAALIAGLWLLWRRRGRVPRHEARIVALLLGIYFAVLLAFGLLMQVRPENTWDFPAVSLIAQDLVLTGRQPDFYFERFPNNAPLLWLYVGVFTLCHAFGAQRIMPGLVVFNCLCITATVLFLYLAARRLWGAKWALFVLLGAFFCPAFLLYAPIAYTDTLSMPFAAGAFWLWLCARRYAREDGRRAAFRAVGAFVLASLGAILKVTVAILVVAFVLDAVLLWRGRARWALLGVGLLLFAVLRVGGMRLAQGALPEYDEPGIPYSHWIMMGLHGTGGYYDPDYEATLAWPTYEERVAFNWRESARRLREMGPLGFLDHCAGKLAYIISDGTYYAPSKLDRGAANPNLLHKFIISGEPYAGFLYYAADAWQLCLLGLCAVGAVRAMRRREDGMTIPRAAVFGLLLFLLIWEARSRYLVNFLPLLLLCAASGLVLRETE